MNHLVVMAKLPEAGRVKTRLARKIGASEARRVYRTILKSTLRVLSQDQRWQTWAAISPKTSLLSPVWPANIKLVSQANGDLGARMQQIFDTFPPGPLIIIGSDIPGISPSDIASGFKALGSRPVVIGPAADGGFWLIGQRRNPRTFKIFNNVRWSSKYAMADTLDNLKHINVARIGEKSDVDSLADYKAWRAGYTKER